MEQRIANDYLHINFQQKKESFKKYNMEIEQKKAVFISVVFLLFLQFGKAQNHTIKEGTFYLNDDGSNYLKATFCVQNWVRYQNLNPSSQVYGFNKASGLDIGIRRYRMQFMGQLSDRIFVYTQVGENNFNYLNDRKLGFFVHDAVGEYSLVKDKFSLGSGLSAWSGLSRFSSPSVGTIMGIDAPLFLQSTNDVTDQFLRKLSVYAKGKLKHFDYRFIVSQPLVFQKSAVYSSIIGENSNFSSKPPHLQYNGYFMYQLKDQESNTTPYMVGTYLGKKKVLTIGAGFVSQKNAMWQLAANKIDTVEKNMLQLSGDVFYDVPTSNNGQALSLYGNYTYFDFGNNYIRNLGVMNPANGLGNKDFLNGAGNNYPAYGTGNVYYMQAGYKLKDSLIGTTTLMPYVSVQRSYYKRLNKAMDFIDLGINWLLPNHKSKVTFAVQNRPIFKNTGDYYSSRTSFLVQYQILIQ